MTRREPCIEDVLDVNLEGCNGRLMECFGFDWRDQRAKWRIKIEVQSSRQRIERGPKVSCITMAWRALLMDRGRPL